LVVVADREETAVLGGEHLEDGVLRTIQILELVNEQMIPLLLVVRQQRRRFVHHNARQVQDVVVVDELVGAQLGDVS
jgi:hypothetical protein